MQATNHYRRYLVVGTLFTAAWLGLGATYVHYELGWSTLITEDFNELGDFVAGFVAPLAFGWFVLALLLQGKQIALQAEELHLQRQELVETRKTLEAQREEMAKAADQAEAQAEAIKANELHARRDTFFRIAELHERDLNFHADEVLRLLHPGVGAGDRWKLRGSGNEFVFASNLVRSLNNLSQEESGRLLSKEAFKVAARRYTRVFRKILDESDSCDPDGVIRGEYEWCPYGELHGLFSTILGKEPEFKWRKPVSVKWLAD